jgi:hypothetical protein
MNKSGLFFLIILWLISGMLLWLIVNNPAKQEEIKKAWGIENYNKLIELYETDIYKAQQAKAIGNFETQLIQLNTTNK